VGCSSNLREVSRGELRFGVDDPFVDDRKLDDFGGAGTDYLFTDKIGLNWKRKGLGGGLCG
jgi:hypothetical protein